MADVTGVFRPNRQARGEVGERRAMPVTAFQEAAVAVCATSSLKRNWQARVRQPQPGCKSDQRGKNSSAGTQARTETKVEIVPLGVCVLVY